MLAHVQEEARWRTKCYHQSWRPQSTLVFVLSHQHFPTRCFKLCIIQHCYVRWPTSVKAKLFSSRQNFLSQGKTLFPKAKLSFLRQNFLSQGKIFFLKTKLSFARQNFLTQGKTFFPKTKLLCQGKTFFLKAKLSFPRQNFLSQDKALLGGNQKKPIQY